MGLQLLLNIIGQAPKGYSVVLRKELFASMPRNCNYAASLGKIMSAGETALEN